jgi:DNA-binding NarL/FixJ family response regulator
MNDLPDQWRAYARLQQILARRHQVDDHVWGIEAGLNRFLSEDPPALEDVERTARSASRKERYQKMLRRVHPVVQESPGNPEDTVDARHRLRVVTNLVTPEDLSLLRLVAEGYEYQEIATAKKTAAGTLRARVHRVRRTLIALAS